MGKTSTVHEQKHKIGATIIFKGYDGGETGKLVEGDELKVTGFDNSEDLYNVERVSDGFTDSLYDVEFEAGTAAPVKAAKVAAVAAPKAEKVLAEVVEPPVAVKAAKVVKEVAAPKAEKPAKEAKVKKAPAAPVVEPGDEEDEAEGITVKDDPKTLAVVQRGEEAEAVVEAVVERKAAKTEKLEPYAGDAPLPLYKQTKSVSEALAEHEGDALNTAKDLAERKERTIFTLGGVLAYIKRNDTFTLIVDEVNGKEVAAYKEGNAGFNQYVKEELGLESRQAAYYVDLYEMFSQVTTEAKIQKIGWTKLREMLPLRNIITKDNVDEWLGIANGSTTAELHDSVTKTLVESGEKVHGNRVTTEQAVFKFTVHEDQGTIAEEAIEKAKGIMGEGTTDSAAFMHIMQEWLTMGDSE